MRISTGEIWNNALNNLMHAQQRQNTANTQYTTQKVATDLGGYGRSSEIIAAYQASLAKSQNFIEVNKVVSDRLDSQDLALTRTSDAASTGKDAIMSALASGDGSALMTALQGSFSAALDGLNYVHNGQYVFGGGNDDNQPVTATSLSQLSALSSAAAAFQNGTIKKTSRIDQHTTIQTGMLASDLGQALMQTFADLQKFNDTNVDGPFGGQLTDAQKTYLTTKSQEFATEFDKLTEQTSLNGTLQNRVDNTTTSLSGQVTSLKGLISDRTDVDLGKAYADLQQAQMSVQASAQVLSNLNQSSLLNLLR
jgi:flagellar hook-associated protein 3 FlgL